MTIYVFACSTLFFPFVSSSLQAVKDIHDSVVSGRKVYCGRAQKKVERSRELMRRKEEQRQERLQRYQGVNLYIKNLEDTLTEEKLKTEFMNFGNITSAKVCHFTNFICNACAIVICICIQISKILIDKYC